MKEAAPQAAKAADRVIPRCAAHMCRKCTQAVTVTGDPEWGPAVHTATDDEFGADGHLVAPIDADIARAVMARRAGARR
jgi:hypothetical protein